MLDVCLFTRDLPAGCFVSLRNLRLTIASWLPELRFLAVDYLYKLLLSNCLLTVPVGSSRLRFVEAIKLPICKVGWMVAEPFCTLIYGCEPL